MAQMSVMHTVYTSDMPLNVCKHKSIKTFPSKLQWWCPWLQWCRLQYAAITEALTKRDREERSLRRQHPERVTGAADIPEHHSGLKGSSRDRVLNQDTSQYVRLCESYHSLIHYTTSTCTHTHTHTCTHTYTHTHTHTYKHTHTHTLIQTHTQWTSPLPWPISSTVQRHICMYVLYVPLTSTIGLTSCTFPFSYSENRTSGGSAIKKVDPTCLSDRRETSYICLHAVVVQLRMYACTYLRTYVCTSQGTITYLTISTLATYIRTYMPY